MIWNKIFTLLNSFAIHSTDHAALTSLPSQTIPIQIMSVKYLTIELRTVRVLTSKCDQCHKASQCHCRASPLTADWINTQLHHSGSQQALTSRNLPQCDWQGFLIFSLNIFLESRPFPLVYADSRKISEKITSSIPCQNPLLWAKFSSMTLRYATHRILQTIFKSPKSQQKNTSLLLFSELGFLFASFLAFNHRHQKPQKYVVHYKLTVFPTSKLQNGPLHGSDTGLETVKPDLGISRQR